MRFQLISPSLKLRDGGVAAVRAAQRGADAETSFSEIQAVAHGTADAVVRNPLGERVVHAALIHQIFDEPADRIIGERGDYGRVQTKAALQAARDIVFAAAFADGKLARGPDALVARVEAQHHFAQAQLIPTATFFRFDVHRSSLRTDVS